MKKYTQIFTILFLTVLLISCDDEASISEPEDLNEQIVTGVLSSIQIERVSCNLRSSVINFENNAVKDVIYSHGGKSQYAYLNGLLSERKEYHSNGFLLFTYTYDYDTNGRLIEINRFPNYDNPIIGGNSFSNVVGQFEYNADFILRSDIYYEFDGSINSTQSYEKYYYTNSEGLIIKFEDLGWEEVITYGNGNPSSINQTSGDSISLTHYEGVDMTGYNLKEYMFGAHWKINSKLAFFDLLSSRTTTELLGNDLLKSYEVLDANGNLKRSLNVIYEVDEQGRLENQYREFTTNGNLSSESVTYLFEE